MIGLPELLVVLIVVLIVLGPKRLPKLARSLGLAVKEYKKAAGEIPARKRKVKNPAG